MHENDASYPQRYAGRNPDLRAADQDREAVAEILREQHLAGRLNTDEFQERLDRCYAAKTYGELDGLIADLPGTGPELREPRAWRRRPSLALLPVLLLFLAAVALSHGHLLWLAIPLFFFVGRPLLWGSSGRRFGWGLVACGHRRSAPPGSYF